MTTWDYYLCSEFKTSATGIATGTRNIFYSLRYSGIERSKLDIPNTHTPLEAGTNNELNWRTKSQKWLSCNKARHLRRALTYYLSFCWWWWWPWWTNCHIESLYPQCLPRPSFYQAKSGGKEWSFALYIQFLIHRHQRIRRALPPWLTHCHPVSERAPVGTTKYFGWLVSITKSI